MGGPQTLVAISLTVPLVVLVVLVIAGTVVVSEALRMPLVDVVVPDSAPVSKLVEVVTPPGERGEVAGTGSRLGGPKVGDDVAVSWMLRTIELGGVLGAP